MPFALSCAFPAHPDFCQASPNCRLNKPGQSRPNNPRRRSMPLPCLAITESPVLVSRAEGIEGVLIRWCGAFGSHLFTRRRAYRVASWYHHPVKSQPLGTSFSENQMPCLPGHPIKEYRLLLDQDYREPSLVTGRRVSRNRIDVVDQWPRIRGCEGANVILRVGNA